MILSGLLLAGIGLLMTLGAKFGFLGKPPGDIRIERENFTLFFPLGTCLLISSLLTLLICLFRR